MQFRKLHVSLQDLSDNSATQRILNTIQQNVGEKFNELDKVSLLNNVLLKNVSVNTSATINHGLGREPVGYIVVRKSANAQIWDTAITADSLTINSSAAITITLYVF